MIICFGHFRILYIYGGATTPLAAKSTLEKMNRKMEAAQYLPSRHVPLINHWNIVELSNMNPHLYHSAMFDRFQSHAVQKTQVLK